MSTQLELVDDWDSLRRLLVNELKHNECVFNEAKFLSHDQISTAYREVVDVDAFMDVLENTFPRQYLVKFLENLTDHIQLYASHGTIKLADYFRKYEENAKRREPYARNHGFLPDQNFVGRETEMKDMKDLLFCTTEPDTQPKKIIGNLLATCIQIFYL